MPRIVYQDQSGQEQTIRLGRERPSITIGRHPECDITTTNGSVSRRHCNIRVVPDGVEILDQNSSSGTYINNLRINRQILLDGDEIYCGSFVVRFHADNDKTFEQERPVRLRGQLSFHNDNNEEIEVWLDDRNPRVLVGRAVECEIRTTDGSVSRRHSEFNFGNNTFEVRDLGSSNGTFVNGQQIFAPQKLRGGDEVACGRLIIHLIIEEELAPAGMTTPAPPPPLRSDVMAPIPGGTGTATAASGSMAPLSAAVAPLSGPRPTLSGPAGMGAPPPPPSISGARPAFSGPSGIAAPPPPPPIGAPPPLSAVPPLSAPPPIQARAEVAPAPIQARAEVAPAPIQARAEVAPSFPGPGNGQLEQLETQLTRAIQERDELAQLLDDRSSSSDGRVRELEREVNQKQVVIDSFQERYDRLKEQAEDQLQQIETYRDELRQKREAIGDLQHKLDLIEEANDRGNNQVAVLIEENASLKVRVNQLERDLAESDRLSNLNEFELKRVRSELENLREMVSSEGNENADLQNEIVRLRQVLDAKETDLIEAERALESLRAEVGAYRTDSTRNNDDVDRLKRDLDDRQRRLDDLLRDNQILRERLDSAVDSDEITELREANRLLKGELELTREELDKLSTAGNAQNQINELKRLNRDMRHQFDEANARVEALEAELANSGGGGDGGGADPEAEARHREEADLLRRQISRMEQDLERARRDAANASRVDIPRVDPDAERLRDENLRLQDEVARLRAQSRGPSPTPGGGREMRAEAAATYELLNDVVSQLKNDMQLLQDYVNDVRAVYDAYRRVDTQSLPTLDRVRVEKILRELDPEVTFEELNHIIGECVNNSEDMKGRLLEFKDKVLED